MVLDLESRIIQVRGGLHSRIPVFLHTWPVFLVVGIVSIQVQTSFFIDSAE
jgi:hypothetical protein